MSCRLLSVSFLIWIILRAMTLSANPWTMKQNSQSSSEQVNKYVCVCVCSWICTVFSIILMEWTYVRMLLMSTDFFILFCIFLLVSFFQYFLIYYFLSTFHLSSRRERHQERKCNESCFWIYNSQWRHCQRHSKEARTMVQR